MPTINGVTFTELDGSCSLRASQDGMMGTRILDASWDDRVEAVTALLGKIVYTGTTRTVLAPPDTFPGWENLEAYDLQMEGVKLTGEDSEGGAGYSLARFTVQYKVPDAGQDSQSDGDNTAGQFFDTEQLDFESSYITIPGGGFRFDDATPVLDLSALPVNVINHTFTKRNLVALPTNLGTYLNCTNNAVFNGAAVGTLLFAGAKSTKKVDARGKIAWDVTFNFKERIIGEERVGWNYFYNPASSKFEVVNPLPFPVANFNDLVNA